MLKNGKMYVRSMYIMGKYKEDLLGKGEGNMKENIFSLGLLTIEIAIFYVITHLFDVPLGITIKIGLIWFVFAFIFKHYKVQSTLVWDEIKNMMKAFLCFCVFSIIFLHPDYHILEICCIGFIMFLFSVFIDRMLRIVFRKVLARKTIVIGTGSDAYRVGTISHNNRFALTEVKGFIRMPGADVFEDLETSLKHQVYEYSELDEILNNHHIDQVIIAIPDSSKYIIDDISKKIFDKVKIVKYVPKLDFTMTFNSKINDYDGVLMISTSRGKLGFVERFIKRVIDILAGIAGCLICIPLTLVVRHKNRKSGDTDSIFFKQERIGIDGKPIYIWKYRSMVPNAEQVLEELMANDPAIREEYLTNKKIVNDPRITEIGHMLRKTSLDEFPQFWNVLKGDMSLVGPRPYLPREKEDMGMYYDSIIRCKPGITGMWQANGRSDVGFEDRCKLDDYYYRNWTIGLDMVIVYKTIKSVLYGKGAL